MTLGNMRSHGVRGLAVSCLVCQHYPDCVPVPEFRPRMACTRCGIIGADAVAKAAPDGYTLYLATDGPLTVAASLYKRVPYDWKRDFAPVSMLAMGYQVLIVRASFPARDTVSLNLGMAFAGQTVRIRFRIGTDANSNDIGWELDNLAFDGITNSPFPAFVADQSRCRGVPKKSQ